MAAAAAADSLSISLLVSLRAEPIHPLLALSAKYSRLTIIMLVRVCAAELRATAVKVAKEYRIIRLK